MIITKEEMHRVVKEAQLKQQFNEQFYRTQSSVLLHEILEAFPQDSYICFKGQSKKLKISYFKKKIYQDRNKQILCVKTSKTQFEIYYIEQIQNPTRSERLQVIQITVKKHLSDYQPKYVREKKASRNYTKDVKDIFYWETCFRGEGSYRLYVSGDMSINGSLKLV